MTTVTFSEPGLAVNPSPPARELVPESPLTLNRFARFYAPLAATSLLLTATNPLLVSAMSRSVNPAVALAGFGVRSHCAAFCTVPFWLASRSLRPSS